MRIREEEYGRRADALVEHLRETGLSGAVVFDSAYVLYYTGFAFVPTERPMALVVNADGERGLFVPRLELEHAEANAAVDQVEHYPEYPGESQPTIALARLLDRLGVREPLGADQDGYPWIFGYQGPSLTELTGAAPTRVAAFIEARMAVKSPAEVELLRESAKWGNLAHALLQGYTRAGLTETEVALRASSEATLSMLAAIGPIYRAQSPFSSGAEAGYRGQIGRNAAIPHTLAGNIRFREGDVLVTGATAPVWGYHSELERTMVIGPPSGRQQELFEHMLALQDAAFAAMGSGVRCSDVDRAVRAEYEERGVMEHWKHHVGHAIGLRYHEAPFLDIGDDTELVPGMVMTVEPGLYAEDAGGFRHSDTVVITPDGIEFLTYYPRDLASLTIDA